MTSKAYVVAETALSINGEAGADYAWSMEGVANGAGRVSAQVDLGAAARAFQYRLDLEALWQGTPTQYATLDLYIAEAPDSDATTIDGDVGASDAALGDLDQVRNCRFLGTIVVEDSGVTKMSTSIEFETNARYITLIGINNGGTTMDATDSDFQCVLTPLPVQGQAT